MRCWMAGMLVIMAAGTCRADALSPIPQADMQDDGVFDGHWVVVSYHRGGKAVETDEWADGMVVSKGHLDLTVHGDERGRYVRGQTRFDQSRYPPTVEVISADRSVAGVYLCIGDVLVWAFSTDHRPAGLSETRAGVVVIVLQRQQQR